MPLLASDFTGPCVRSSLDSEGVKHWRISFIGRVLEVSQRPREACSYDFGRRIMLKLLSYPDNKEIAVSFAKNYEDAAIVGNAMIAVDSRSI